MSVRKNAKFVSAAEREAFVKACVLMKADIVNPNAPAGQQYSRWDENVAIHMMIQNAFAPGAASVNFGHGGSGAYAFFSWHRFFLHVVEQQLQSYVPDVLIPYWDWTDPASIMTDTFLGPNGVSGTGVVTAGYFAATAPGTGANTTPAPAWWPAGLTGWQLPTAFGGGAGALKRRIRAVSQLPSATDLRQALAMSTYAAFQNTVESGSGLSSTNQMHNGMHGWIGSSPGQMSYPAYSPFDPFFYLHHCNIDRLWAMWQTDGHADVYPLAGGAAYHNRNDPMYPWVGAAAGFGTNASIAASIPMPDVSAVGGQRNVDTLDHRGTFGYTYDTIAVIGMGLDRTGSMLQATPDPMNGSLPAVTKWDSAKRGVSSFLQDCETVQQSGLTYVVAGVKTFRALGANDFTAIFPAPGYGLVKPGSAVSRSAFDGAVASMTPDGDTPLADALLDVHATLSEPPFGGAPADERRYLALLTDGVLTTGTPMATVPDHSLARTAVFSLGFGTGADVDYATLAALVAKGSETLTSQQVFHGENAGTIDKFYSNALARAIGFTAVIDPVFELFAGEHAHLDYDATSAEDAFVVTAQGMDFDDANWSYFLHGPGGSMAYGDQPGMHGMPAMGGMPGHGADHCCCAGVDVTSSRAAGRLSLVVQRDLACDDCWVGAWRLMVAYRARTMDAMVMPLVGELVVPVAGWPTRGSRFAGALPGKRKRVVASRNVVVAAPANRLDSMPLGTNRADGPSCTAVVTIYGRSRLRVDLVSEPVVKLGEELTFRLHVDDVGGSSATTGALARLVGPAADVRRLVADAGTNVPSWTRVPHSRDKAIDPALVLAWLEQKDSAVGAVVDIELEASVHGDGPMHFHGGKAAVPGGTHLGVFVEGTYCPDHNTTSHDHTNHDNGADVGALPTAGLSGSPASSAPRPRSLTDRRTAAPAPIRLRRNDGPKVQGPGRTTSSTRRAEKRTESKDDGQGNSTTRGLHRSQACATSASGSR
jgi:hypothetical protein